MHSVRPKLVHICGFPSSGTDLLANFMSAHPDIHVRGEFPLLPKLARKFGSMVTPEQYPDVVDALKSGDVWENFLCPPAPLDDLYDGGLIAVADIYAPMLTDRSIKWCGNKTPQNTENLRQLLELFPETRIVFIIRDIRDVCLSWQRKWGKNMCLCATKWNRRMAKGLEVIDSLPEDRVLQLRFEDLIADPAVVGQKISQFLDIEYDDSFLNYHLHVGINADGKRNFGKPIESKNRENWRRGLSESDTRRIEEISYPMMARFGYEPEFAKKHRRLTPIEFCVGYAADLYAVLIIGNRYREKNNLRDRLRKLGNSFRYRFLRG